MQSKKLYTLLFHGVIDTISEHCVFKGSRNCFVRTSDFENAVEYCSRRYKIITPGELETYFNGTAADDGVFITVDDGLQNFFDNGVPVLQKYNAPATVFITSDWTNSGKEPAIFALEYHLFYQLPAVVNIRVDNFSFEKSVQNKTQLPAAFKEIWNFLFEKKITPNSILALDITINGKPIDSFSDEKNPCYWKPASWETLRNAHEKGIIHVGGHGKTHAPWSWLSANELEKEFMENKEQLSRHLNTTASSCTFPFGVYNKETLDVVKKYYTYGFTNRVLAVNNNMNTCLSRYNVPFQRPNTIPSLIAYPFAGKILRKLGSMSQLF